MSTKKINHKQVVIFEGQKIRRIWNEKREKWYFSIIDIISVLTEQVNFKKAQSYWTTLKNRLKSEGNQSVTKCDKLKLQSADGKFYKTDVADVETLLRLIQSVPSPKAEPIKLWLARVGYERIEEINDPEKALNRSRNYWQRMGRSQKWIQQRMMGQEVRNKLTDYWKNNKVKEQDEYAILKTNAFWSVFSPDENFIVIQEAGEADTTDWSFPNPKLVIYDLNNLKEKLAYDLSKYEQGAMWISDWQF